MSGLTNYGENLAAEALLGTGTFYVSLHTGDPGETGASNELSGDGYAREGDTFTITGSVAANDTALEFGPVSADKGTVSHFAIWDAVSGGNCICKGALAVSRAWPSGVLEAAIGDFTLVMD